MRLNTLDARGKIGESHTHTHSTTSAYVEFSFPDNNFENGNSPARLSYMSTPKVDSRTTKKHTHTQTRILTLILPRLWTSGYLGIRKNIIGQYKNYFLLFHCVFFSFCFQKKKHCSVRINLMCWFLFLRGQYASIHFSSRLTPLEHYHECYPQTEHFVSAFMSRADPRIKSIVCTYAFHVIHIGAFGGKSISWCDPPKIRELPPTPGVANDP